MINSGELSDSQLFSLRVYQEETHSKHKDKIPVIDLSVVTAKQQTSDKSKIKQPKHQH